MNVPFTMKPCDYMSINYVLFECPLHADFTHVRLLIMYHWNVPFDDCDPFDR